MTAHDMGAGSAVSVLERTAQEPTGTRQRLQAGSGRWLDVVTFGAITAIVLVAVVPAPRRLDVGLACWLGALAVVATGLLAGRRARRRAAEAAQSRPRPAPLREHLASAVYVAVNLSPVLLLSLAFPLAQHSLSSVSYGGVPLSIIVAASSLTAPWLSQITCRPLYSDLLASGMPPREEAARRFVAAVPLLLVQSVVPVLVLTGPVALVMRWPRAATEVFAALTFLNSLFAMSLVLANALKMRLRWVLAWAVYAAVIAVDARQWYLPPLVAALTQVVPVGRFLRTRPRLRGWALNWREMLRGAAAGGVLWADKYVLLLCFAGSLDIALTFIAALPGVVAYNYYFVRLGPAFDEHVEQLRKSMTGRPHRYTQGVAAGVNSGMKRSLRLVACIAAQASLLLVLVVAQRWPGSTAYAATVAITACIACMITLFLYKLEYLNEVRKVVLIGCAHLACCALLIKLSGSPGAAYVAVALASALVFVLAARLFDAAWRVPEFALFWRQATRW